MPGRTYPIARPASATVMFGRATIPDEKNTNKASANITRVPKKIVRPSVRGSPACTSRSRRDPISFGECGAFSPILLNRPIRLCSRGLPSSSGARPSVSSSIRRSMAAPRLGISATAAAAPTGEPNTNARSGSSITTLHLDLDDALDPQEPERLHDERGHQQHLSHALAKQHVPVFRVG